MAAETTHTVTSSCERLNRQGREGNLDSLPPSLSDWDIYIHFYLWPRPINAFNGEAHREVLHRGTVPRAQFPVLLVEHAPRRHFAGSRSPGEPTST
jgi:hypothetical protein